MGKYKRILVAIDRSESGKNALHQAFNLANEEKCWITVTSVVPPFEGETVGLGVKDIKAALRKPCDDALAEVNKIVKNEHTFVKTVCEEGDVYERIVDLADAENCDVIVMGRHGRRKIERMLMGNVTARVIGHFQRDVFVVPNGTAIGWKIIILATDGSKYSAAAAKRAISLAKSYGGVLKVLSVVDVTSEFYDEAPQAVDSLVQQAKGYVSDVKKQAEDAGVNADTFIREDEVYLAINNLAQEEKANIIIMASHGRTGLRRLLMGSVTEMVIGHSFCPVLVVKS